MRPQRIRNAMIAAAAIAFGSFAGDATAQACEGPCVGPSRGAVVIAGGGRLDDRIFDEFVRLAGGPAAKIVLVPTAGAEDGSHDAWTAMEQLRDAGVPRIEVLHTRSRAVADIPAFSAVLENATGVWFSGGRQWRLVDVYLGTRTEDALHGVVDRGGVIGGNSAGASALASFLLRGGLDNTEVFTDDREEGFGFLQNTAVDQHVAERGRENAMFEVLRGNPHLLGIGLNEGAALVIRGDLARVIGGQVAIYDVTDPLTLIPLRWLGPGDAYDLGTRSTLLTESDRTPPEREPPPPFVGPYPFGGGVPFTP